MHAFWEETLGRRPAWPRLCSAPARVAPITVGTVAAPRETVRSTGDRCGSTVHGGEFWASTVPGAATSTIDVTFPTVSPASWILATAEPYSVRATSGTLVAGAGGGAVSVGVVVWGGPNLTGVPGVHPT